MNPADAQVLEVAKLMAGGASFVEAMQAVGVQWSVKTFQRNVARVLGRAVLSAAERSLLTGASTAAAEAAGAAGGGGLLAALAARLGISVGMLVGGIVGIVIIGGVAYYVYRANSDAPAECIPAESPAEAQLQKSAILGGGCDPSDETSSAGSGSAGGSGGTSGNSSAGGASSGAGAGGAAGQSTKVTCEAPKQVTKKCPWTPDGYAVNPCNEGFCWDGGPQGSLACKPEKSVPNAVRTDTNGLRCADGFTAKSDACTGLITACTK